MILLENIYLSFRKIVLDFFRNFLLPIITNHYENSYLNIFIFENKFQNYSIELNGYNLLKIKRFINLQKSQDKKFENPCIYLANKKYFVRLGYSLVVYHLLNQTISFKLYFLKA